MANSNYTFRRYDGREMTVLASSESAAEKVVRSRDWKSFEMVLKTNNLFELNKRWRNPKKADRDYWANRKKTSSKVIPNMNKLSTKKLWSIANSKTVTFKQAKFARKLATRRNN